jgi:predicted ABC-type transport system involved in lysophospholipase L1 biosynthesis ATPase subunit
VLPWPSPIEREVEVSVLVVDGVCLGRSRGAGWVPVLAEVSFDVERGEVVAIVGGRRSGKTTLLEIAAGIRTPERGSVRLGEHELSDMPESKRVRLRGRELVFLDRAGMSQQLYVEKIVGWPLSLTRGRREAQRRAWQMLERVGTTDCARKRWKELSPWEQVRVGLARGFVLTPKLLVVDDLLDGLGSEATTQASRLLRSLIAETASSSGVLMSTSDRASAVFADRVWSLRGGRLAPTSGHSRSNADVVPLRRVAGND